MQRNILLLSALFAAAACDTPRTDEPPSDRSAAATVQGPATDGDIYRAAVANPDRADADRARDARRHPAAVLDFFGIVPGMHVLDLYSGGGYYTELLSRVVGPDGRVRAHNNQAYLGFAAAEIEARYADERLPNVSILMAENNELELVPEAYDAITMVLTYHDIYYVDPDNGWPAIDGARLLGELYEGLKPGGVLGLVDHYAAPGSPAETGGTTHRIDAELVIREMQDAGFELDGRSDILRNPDDDHSRIVFDPAVRGQTDRFVLRFRKPG